MGSNWRVREVRRAVTEKIRGRKRLGFHTRSQDMRDINAIKWKLNFLSFFLSLFFKRYNDCGIPIKDRLRTRTWK